MDACLKFTTTTMFYFYHSKNPSIIMKNVCNSLSYILEKNLLVNKFKKKQMPYEKKISIF